MPRCCKLWMLLAIAHLKNAGLWLNICYFSTSFFNVCSKVCSCKAKERRNKRSYALLAGAEDGT